MGKIKAPVSVKVVESGTKTEGMHAVGGTAGLYLCVKGAGASWILRYTFAGRRHDLGLGSYTILSLAEAREMAREHRKLILHGIDPMDARREQRNAQRAAFAKRSTFSECVEGYLKAHGDGWRNPEKQREQWRSSLEIHAGKPIGNLNVASVDTSLVVKILEPIWKTKTSTATRLRSRIERVLSWATVRGFRQGENPARWRGHLDQLLAKVSTVLKETHHPALPYAELGAFMQELRKHDGIGAAALEFAILTAARSGEVRGATWSEIDLKARVWIISAERMKMSKEHRVPLSSAAVAVIKKMQDCKLNDYVFPGAKEVSPLSDMSLSAVLRRMDRDDLTVHGFRSSFRDWCAESTGYPSEVAEMALAHTINNKVEAAYRRGDLFEKRVRLMSEWAAYCGKPLKAGNVVPIKRAAR